MDVAAAYAILDESAPSYAPYMSEFYGTHVTLWRAWLLASGCDQITVSRMPFRGVNRNNESVTHYLDQDGILHEVTLQ